MTIKQWCSIFSALHDLPSNGYIIFEGPTLIPIVGLFTNTERGRESILGTFYHFYSQYASI
jgi:hypothetical protein